MEMGVKRQGEVARVVLASVMFHNGIGEFTQVVYEDLAHEGVSKEEADDLVLLLTDEIVTACGKSIDRRLAAGTLQK